jgi:hypothetical protein
MGSPARHFRAVCTLGLAACAAAWAACSSSPGSNVPPPLGDDDGGGDVTVDGQADTTTNGPPPGDGGLDAPRDAHEDGDAMTRFDVSVDVQPLLPCGPSPAWGQPVTVLTTSTADSTIFAGITNDELSIAWTSVSGGVVTAWYADRASNTAAFGAPQALASSFGALAFDRVSLSGDGLRIVGVRADGTGFVAATRAARPGTFDTDDSAEFAVFAPDGSADASTYASPMLSPDDQVFAYLLTSSADDNDLMFSGGPGWSKSVSPGIPELARMNGQQRRPTGMTLDELSLFYWDEVTGTEKVVYFAPTDLFADLGAWKDAVPVGQCSRIYYSVPASGGALTIVYVGQSGQ